MQSRGSWRGGEGNCCTGMSYPVSGDGSGAVEVVSSPDKHNSCSNPLPERLEKAGKMALLSPLPLDVTPKKLLFAGVLLFQT